MRIQQNAQRRNNKQAARNNAANANEEEYNASGRYGGGGERAKYASDSIVSIERHEVIVWCLVANSAVMKSPSIATLDTSR